LGAAIASAVLGRGQARGIWLVARIFGQNPRRLTQERRSRHHDWGSSPV